MEEVELRKLTRDTYLDAFRMKLLPEQEDLVADNIASLAQAYFHKEARPFGLYRGDEPVGFVMLSVEELAQGIVWVWRFMIDHRVQRQGLGLKAMGAVINHVKAMPEASKLCLSHNPREGGAGPFYLQLGFTYTGEIEHDEPVMELQL